MMLACRLAIAERAYQQAVSYARDRVQGTPLEGEKGQAIVHHPDVLRLLTGMRAEIEACGPCFLLAGSALIGRTTCPEMRRSVADAGDLLIPVIKGWMTERSLQRHPMPFRSMAAWGYRETGAAQHFRDARILPIYEAQPPSRPMTGLPQDLRDNGAAVRDLIGEIRST